MWSKTNILLKVAQKGKTFSRLLEPQEVAPNTQKLLKRCRAQSEQAWLEGPIKNWFTCSLRLFVTYNK